MKNTHQIASFGVFILTFPLESMPPDPLHILSLQIHTFEPAAVDSGCFGTQVTITGTRLQEILISKGRLLRTAVKVNPTPVALFPGVAFLFGSRSNRKTHKC